jgi:multiple sugar transport system substrate-binding protein
MLMLMYRQDVFDALHMDPPRTWPEYQAVLKTLHEADSSLRDSNGNPLPTTVLAPTKDHWAAEWLLVRSAGSIVRRGRLSSYFEIESMKPLVASPPFVDALEQLVAEQSSKDGTWRTPAENYAAMLQGEAAMVVAWPSSHASLENVNGVVPVGVAPLPGAVRLYDYRQQTWESSGAESPATSVLVPVAGRIAAISRQTRRLRTAQRMIAWLTTAEANREFSNQFSDLLFVQSSQLMEPYAWVNDHMPREVASQMASVLRGYHEQALFVVNLRIPGRDDYMQALADAVRAALAGDVSPQVALDAAAVRWEQITDRLSRDSQRKWFQASVGVD